MENIDDHDMVLYYQVDYTLTDIPKDAGYFHAQFRRVNPLPLKKDYVLVDSIRGKGQYVGTYLAYGSLKNGWWGEGEIKFFMDGDTKFPTINGTGTEDYVGAAWGLGAFINRNQGCSVADAANRQWAFYRFHLPDPIYFQHDCKVAIQVVGGGTLQQVRKIAENNVPLMPITVDRGDKGFVKLLEQKRVPKLTDNDFPDGWVNFFRQDDYCATAYFYLDEPYNDLPKLPPIEVRTAALK